MRIAYFNATMRVGQDGVTRCIYRMIDGIRERGHEAIAITATLPLDKPPIPMFRVPSVAFPLQPTYRLAVPGFQSFQRQLQAFRPDIIHINSPCTLGFAAMRYGRTFGVPVVATYHTHFPSYPRYYNISSLEEMTWRLSRMLYNRVDRTFVPTRPILDELREHGVRHLDYLPNGVDTTLFNPAFRSDLWRYRFGGGTKPILLFVSRLVWEKDLRDLSEMYRLLRSKQSVFEMVVVGDGHARSELEEMMPGAHFLGYESGRTLAESFASADIFVFPSTTETFGLVTLEAMASGLAPVAAGIGGAAEIIQDGSSGLLAAPNNPEDLARKVGWLIEHPVQREVMSDYAIERAHLYRWDRILDRLTAAYGEVILNSKGGTLERAA